ncbi:MAG: aminotransferase class V-fold PLP-dependent enzyme [Alphaproteobacteria bacterium]|nr:aminotransferase class V-fold PLP-dependent enzyme [Alphaproteobacteria bacterium]MBT4964573.1 aminotransferase class V-fold PLP-dependent enzyme [Alphaproteobacteria bacterium]MBT5159032.1 aminotransferase class V-fold PLP-dependent enzyme [Alphaproteobacteria bacterium]MBT5918042.1 aminotransferase class V-fold PLP-dependent enzyme [Alphaproteobacteria bacterium]MBT6385109.1 aminotransferase class V-fold PLP-dependent enzyme [Alphaproteobacteria bacterium]
MVDWMASYLETVETRPVRAQVQPGDIAAQLPTAAPDAGEDMTDIMADFEKIVVPGITNWQHPKFFAYFPSNSSPPSVLAEMLVTTMGAQCMLWQTSPAATEMETRMMEWLAKMLGLGDGFEGVIQDSASSATLVAILVGREKATDWAANEQGLKAVQPLAVYASAEAHSSIEKDVMVAGLGRQSLRKIAVDENLALVPAELEAAIEADIAAGIKPAVVVACLGTTGTGAIDPLRAIGEICRRHDIYLHVDAAWAGTALLLEEQRAMIDGIEHADSFVFNPHKWMFTNFDCSAHFIRDSESLIKTLSILPAYLQSRETGSVIDYRDWSVPLGRRFRALKLWFVIRSMGVDGMKAKLRDQIKWAENLEATIVAEPEVDLLVPRSLTLLTFRWTPEGMTDEAELDAFNEKLVHAVNDDGRLYLTQTHCMGHYAIRFVIGQTNTTQDDVVSAWADLKEIAGTI